MGSSKKQTVGYRYGMGLHFGVCHGPVDKLLQIEVGERVAWNAGITASGQIFVDREDLFGGDEREGGIQSHIDVMMGEPTQVANGYLTQAQGSPQSAHRGFLGLVFRRGHIASNNPYIKPWAFKVRRILKGWRDDSPWYPAKATIGLGGEGAGGSGTPFYENFPNLAPYSTITGSGALFSAVASPYGGALNCAAQVDGTQATIERDLPGPVTPTRISVKFQMPDIGSSADDGAILQFRAGGVEVFAINPRREAIYDATRRARFYINGTEHIIGDAALDEDVWYWLEVEFDHAANTWAAQFKLANSGTVLETFSGSGVVADADDLRFTIAPVLLGEPPSVHTQYAAIELDVVGGPIRAMNPAHIIYECLTNQQWGMGWPTSIIDDASFTAAADTLFNEGFGLCMAWTRQVSIEAFVQTVVDHIGGFVTQSRTTGKFVLVLVRDDYDVDELPIFSDSAGNVLELERFDRVSPAEGKNEIIVKYADAASGKDAAAPPAQNLAAIQAQGAVISETKTYAGLPTLSLAVRVAERDLKGAAAGLARVKLRVNRKGNNLAPGSVIKFAWTPLGIAQLVLRVVEVDYGTFEDGTIVLSCVEDVFGLPEASYLEEEEGGWEEPDTGAAASEAVEMMEATYRDLYVNNSPADFAQFDDASAFVIGFAKRPPTGTGYSFALDTRVAPADFEERETDSWAPHGVLVDALAGDDTGATLQDFTDLDAVEVGDLCLVGGLEICRVDAINPTTGAVTLGRGCVDTVPRSHLAGADVFFYSSFAAFDATEYAGAETVDGRFITLAGSGVLPDGDAPTDSVTTAERFARPYPPADLQLNGERWPTQIDLTGLGAELEVSWLERNRVTQADQVLDTLDPTVTPEVGTTYNVELYDTNGDLLVESAIGVTGTSVVLDPVGYSFDARIEVYAVRDGFESWQRQIRTFQYINTAARVVEEGDERITEEGDRIRVEE